MKALRLKVKVSNDCNSNCTYCYQKLDGSLMKLDTVEKVINGIQRVLESELFTANHSRITIVFTGGEPTLNMMAVYRIMEAFQENAKVDFEMETNALDAVAIKNIPPSFNKLTFVINYNGGAIYEASHPNTTYTTPQKHIVDMLDAGRMVRIKPIVPREYLYLLPKLYKEMNQFKEVYPNIINESFSFEFDDLQPYSKESMNTKKHMSQLKEAYVELIGMLLDGYSFPIESFDVNKRPTMEDGINTFSIDCDGSVFISIDGNDNLTPEKVEMLSLCCDIDDIYSPETIYAVHDSFRKYESTETDECTKCFVRYCNLNKNVSKLRKSPKESFISSWIDYSSQGCLCRLTQVIATARLAYEEFLNGTAVL